jgi:hypothetical protein
MVWFSQNESKIEARIQPAIGRYGATCDRLGCNLQTFNCDCFCDSTTHLCTAQVAPDVRRCEKKGRRVGGRFAVVLVTVGEAGNEALVQKQ